MIVSIHRKARLDALSSRLSQKVFKDEVIYLPLSMLPSSGELGFRANLPHGREQDGGRQAEIKSINSHST